MSRRPLSRHDAVAALADWGDYEHVRAGDVRPYFANPGQYWMFKYRTFKRRALRTVGIPRTRGGSRCRVRVASLAPAVSAATLHDQTTTKLTI
jgi:hypothetical protein